MALNKKRYTMYRGWVLARDSRTNKWWFPGFRGVIATKGFSTLFDSPELAKRVLDHLIADGFHEEGGPGFRPLAKKRRSA